MRIKTKLVGAVLGIALFAAGPAYAQSLNPTQDGYSQPGAQVQQQVSNGGPKGPPAAAAVQSKQESGGLPFTGLQVGIVLAAGFALVATGLGVQRIARRGVS